MLKVLFAVVTLCVSACAFAEEPTTTMRDYHPYSDVGKRANGRNVGISGDMKTNMPNPPVWMQNLFAPVPQKEPVIPSTPNN